MAVETSSLFKIYIFVDYVFVSEHGSPSRDNLHHIPTFTFTVLNCRYSLEVMCMHVKGS